MTAPQRARRVTGQGPLAPGVTHVRLTGGQDDTAALAGLLAAVPGLEVLTGPDGPYPNRRPPGQRLYLTVRLTPPPTTDTVTTEMEGHPMTSDPATVADPGAETAEPETDAEFLGTGPDGWEHFRITWRDVEPEAEL